MIFATKEKTRITVEVSSDKKEYDSDLHHLGSLLSKNKVQFVRLKDISKDNKPSASMV